MSDEHQVRQLAADINARLELSADAAITTDTEALYRGLPYAALVALRHGFTFDREAGANTAFCQGRIDLITRILEVRIRNGTG